MHDIELTEEQRMIRDLAAGEVTRQVADRKSVV